MDRIARVKEEKTRLRQKMRQQLTALSPLKRTEASEEILEKLTALLSLSTGSKIALFAGTRREPDLLPLISQFPQTQWYLPKITGPRTMVFLEVKDACQLRPGRFGILEPNGGKAAEEIDFALCPGLAFTSDGGRLGQGAGFYDAFLQDHPATTRYGVSFKCQLVDSLPLEPHDLRMKEVITSESF